MRSILNLVLFLTLFTASLLAARPAPAAPYNPARQVSIHKPPGINPCIFTDCPDPTPVATPSPSPSPSPTPSAEPTEEPAITDDPSENSPNSPSGNPNQNPANNPNSQDPGVFTLAEGACSLQGGLAGVPFWGLSGLVSLVAALALLRWKKSS